VAWGRGEAWLTEGRGPAAAHAMHCCCRNARTNAFHAAQHQGRESSPGGASTAAHCPSARPSIAVQAPASQLRLAPLPAPAAGALPDAAPLGIAPLQLPSLISADEAWQRALAQPWIVQREVERANDVLLAAQVLAAAQGQAPAAAAAAEIVQPLPQVEVGPEPEQQLQAAGEAGPAAEEAPAPGPAPAAECGAAEGGLVLTERRDPAQEQQQPAVPKPAYTMQQGKENVCPKAADVDAVGQRGVHWAV